VGGVDHDQEFIQVALGDSPPTDHAPSAKAVNLPIRKCDAARNPPEDRARVDTEPGTYGAGGNHGQNLIG
jgi:hypothetical protein